MTTQAFGNPTAWIGTDGWLLLPFLDVDTQGSPVLTAGPEHERADLRIVVTMPSKEEAEKLPAPGGYDRERVLFHPVAIVLTGATPPDVTARFYRVLTSEEGSRETKVAKKPLHQWEASDETGMNPSLKITTPPLRPGGWVEVWGHSWFISSAVQALKKAGIRRMASWRLAPTAAIRQPVELSLLVEAKWPIARKTEMRMQGAGMPLKGLRQVPRGW